MCTSQLWRGGRRRCAEGALQGRLSRSPQRRDHRRRSAASQCDRGHTTTDPALPRLLLSPAVLPPGRPGMPAGRGACSLRLVVEVSTNFKEVGEDQPLMRSEIELNALGFVSDTYRAPTGSTRPATPRHAGNRPRDASQKRPATTRDSQKSTR